MEDGMAAEGDGAYENDIVYNAIPPRIGPRR